MARVGGERSGAGKVDRPEGRQGLAPTLRRGMDAWQGSARAEDVGALQLSAGSVDPAETGRRRPCRLEPGTCARMARFLCRLSMGRARSVASEESRPPSLLPRGPRAGRRAEGWAPCWPASPRPPPVDRVVHLPAGLVEELEEHLAHYVHPARDGLVFTTEGGGPLRQSNFRNRHWLPALSEAGSRSIAVSRSPSCGRDVGHGLRSNDPRGAGGSARVACRRLPLPARARQPWHAEIAERLNAIFAAPASAGRP